MKIFYHIPIVLCHAMFQFHWTEDYEMGKELKAKSLKKAQKLAEKKFESNKEYNLLFFIPDRFPQPNDKQKEELKKSYPKKFTLVVVEKPEVYIKEVEGDWHKEETIELFFQPVGTEPHERV